MEKIKLMINKYREIIVYVFIGGCTTLVNLITYTAMYKLFDFDINISNITSIVVAIIFAYFANKIIVFQSIDKSFKTLISEGIKFLGSRLFTMIIEVYGVYLLVVVNGDDKFLGKVKVQVIILVLNYLMSKFIVFKK